VRGRLAGGAARAREMRAVVISRAGETISIANQLRRVLIFTLLLAAPTIAHAQSSSAAPASQPAQDFLSLPSQAIHYGSWEIGGFVGGGLGDGHDADTDFMFGGIRAGRVLTDDHGPGALRGNFEMLGEIRPVYEVLTPANGHVYGFHFMPIILRWNFKGWKRMSPYGQLAGGILFSTSRLPPGDTSSVNFTPQGAAGLNIFTKPGQAVAIEFVEFHHSNANLGNKNPGYNAGFLFTIGYMWYHGWRK
jgi:lipid A 3-O-deacylase